MTTIEAIYENGVLRPLTPLALQEHERVEVTVQTSRESRLAALKRVSERREKLRQKIGTLPDSTPLIREDRMRDI